MILFYCWGVDMTSRQTVRKKEPSHHAEARVKGSTSNLERATVENPRNYGYILLLPLGAPTGEGASSKGCGMKGSVGYKQYGVQKMPPRTGWVVLTF
jgi:hypothetical protein